MNGKGTGKKRDPYKFDEEKADDVLKAIRGGNFLETAAAFAGVTPKTLREWVRRGAREKEGRLFDFSVAFAQAEADAEIHALAQITRAGQKEWAAAAWRLERRFRARWGRPSALELSGPGGGPLEANVHTLSDLVRAAAAAGAKKKAKVGIFVPRPPTPDRPAGGDAEE